MAEPHRYGLSAGRWLAIHVVIVVVVGMQLLDVVKPGERWPFAPYAMYASTQGNHFSWYRIYGVSAAGEFPLDRDAFYSPIDGPRLAYSFAGRRPRPGVIVPPTADMLRVVGTLYERARRAGRHDGPPLVGLRLYAVTWALDRTLESQEHPAPLVLLEEVRSGE